MEPVVFLLRLALFPFQFPNLTVFAALGENSPNQPCLTTATALRAASPRPICSLPLP